MNIENTELDFADQSTIETKQLIKMSSIARNHQENGIKMERNWKTNEYNVKFEMFISLKRMLICLKKKPLGECALPVMMYKPERLVLTTKNTDIISYRYHLYLSAKSAERYRDYTVVPNGWT